MAMPQIRKKTSKDEREKEVLIGLIELYISTGRPIGSDTLKEQGFANLSSATIRNYFVKLEEEGFLAQQHSSGGRIPTPLAFRFYANRCLEEKQLDAKDKKQLRDELLITTKEVASYLEKATETLSEFSHCATFLSSPRFDQDFITDIKVLPIDENRCICAVVTDFGLVHTEILRADKKLSQFSAKRLEAFFRYKLTGLDMPELTPEEESIAKRFYSELMLRQVVGHTNFYNFDIYKTGFSRLLKYEDFNELTRLAGVLSLFENDKYLQNMLSDTQRLQTLMVWLGSDLSNLGLPKEVACSVITIPYHIHHQVVGSFGIIGPLRMPYKKLFSLLHVAADYISKSLTQSIYKFKISYRKPSIYPSQLTEQKMYELTMLPLLENKPHSEGETHDRT